MTPLPPDPPTKQDIGYYLCLLHECLLTGTETAKIHYSHTTLGDHRGLNVSLALSFEVKADDLSEVLKSVALKYTGYDPEQDAPENNPT